MYCQAGKATFSHYRKMLTNLNLTEMNIGDKVYHIKAQKELTIQKINIDVFMCLDADGKKCVCNKRFLIYHGPIITTPFKGNCLTIYKGGKVLYTDSTITDYLAEESAKLITWEEFDALYAAYFTYPFAPITEEQYDDYLGQMYPKNWHDIAPGINVFFCEEATSGSFHACYIHDRNNNTYWGGTKSIFTSDADLLGMYSKESVAARVNA